MFARDRILKIEIQMAPADWREVRLSHRDGSDEMLSQLSNDDAYKYKPAEITIDGVRVARVGVRKKGLLGSVVSTRPALKVKFDEYVDGQTYSGLDGLTLNNNNQDEAMVQTFLAYDLFARAGVPASRANFAHVRVNGEDLGVYTHVEAIGRAFLRRVFGSSNGVLYESYAGDFSNDRFFRIVEKGGEKDQDRTRLAALRDALAVTGPVSPARISELVDLDSFLRMWAMESLMGHWDSYSGNRNNYYLYVDPATKRIHFIPWGPDAIFADPGPLQAFAAPKSFKAMGVLSRRLMELPEMRARYQALMREMLAGPWSESRITSDLKTLQRQLLPLSHLEAKTVEEATASIASFLSRRRTEVTAELTTPGPAWPDESLPGLPRAMTLSGSFSAPWSVNAPIDPFSAGKGEIAITVAGKPLPAFDGVAAFATAHKQRDTAIISKIREKYGFITITARAGAEIWQVSFTIDPYLLQAGPGKFPVDHYSVWAVVVQLTGGIPKVRPFGNVGELRLEQVNASPGGVLKGTFTLRGFAPS